ncbi:hypothetical protein BJ742DRAFT_878856 [Cladochytrium replicatum]|nr:hypothetical protein BJ742DRAFT_878856 [Cladochytrium replicatum]
MAQQDALERALPPQSGFHVFSLKGSLHFKEAIGNAHPDLSLDSDNRDIDPSSRLSVTDYLGRLSGKTSLLRNDPLAEKKSIQQQSPNFGKPHNSSQTEPSRTSANIIHQKRTSPSAVHLETMLGGAISFLESAQMVNDIRLCSRSPATPGQIVEWERENGFALPEDLASFLATTDGLMLTWSVKTTGHPLKSPQATDPEINSRSRIDINVKGGEDSEMGCEVKVGLIQVNALDRIQFVHQPLSSTAINEPPETRLEFQKQQPRGEMIRNGSPPSFWPFESPPGPAAVIHETPGIGKTCICYVDVDSDINGSKRTEIWFQDTSMMVALHQDGPIHRRQSRQSFNSSWYYMTNSFSAYWRLLVCNLGITGWELAFTRRGLPRTSMEWMNFYLPNRARIYRTIRISRFGAPTLNGGGFEYSNDNLPASAEATQQSPESNSRQSYEQSKAIADVLQPPAGRSVASFPFPSQFFDLTQKEGRSYLDMERLTQLCKTPPAAQTLNPAVIGSSLDQTIGKVAETRTTSATNSTARTLGSATSSRGSSGTAEGRDRELFQRSGINPSPPKSAAVGRSGQMGGRAASAMRR